MTAGAALPHLDSHAAVEQCVEEWVSLRSAREKLWLRRGLPLSLATSPSGLGAAAAPLCVAAASADTQCAPGRGGIASGERAVVVKGAIKLSPLPAMAHTVTQPVMALPLPLDGAPSAASGAITITPDNTPQACLPLFQTSPAPSAAARPSRSVRWSQQASVKRYEREAEPRQVQSQPEDCEAIVSPMYQHETSWDQQGDPSDAEEECWDDDEVCMAGRGSQYCDRSGVQDYGGDAVAPVYGRPMWDRELDDELDRVLRPQAAAPCSWDEGMQCVDATDHTNALLCS
jgi:hypothetical protein